jgi:hypothetical protein
MRYSKFFSFILIISNFIFSIIKCDDEIRFVFEMFRHGARAPWNSLDQTGRDLFNETWSGAGELSEVGMRQHYLLGYRNRVRYGNFLSKSYDPKEIYVVSTDVNRTIMSAASHLQGLYSPGTGPVLNPSQNKNTSLPPVGDFNFTEELNILGSSSLPYQMQVFPIHLFDKKAGNAQLYESSVCPAVSKYVEKNKSKNSTKELLVRFNDTYGAQMKAALNVTESTLLDYWFIYKIVDTFICDYTEGKNMTVLINAGIDLEQFKNYTIDFLKNDILEVNFGDEDHYVARVAMSPTARELVN